MVRLESVLIWLSHYITDIHRMMLVILMWVLCMQRCNSQNRRLMVEVIDGPELWTGPSQSDCLKIVTSPYPWTDLGKYITRNLYMYIWYSSEVALHRYFLINLSNTDQGQCCEIVFECYQMITSVIFPWLSLFPWILQLWLQVWSLLIIGSHWALFLSVLVKV